MLPSSGRRSATPERTADALRNQCREYRTVLTLAPLPVQRPRVPVWIGGASPRPGAGSHAGMLARISAGPLVPDLVRVAHFCGGDP